MIWVMGDSHISHLHERLQGLTSTSIRGGRLNHVIEYLDQCDLKGYQMLILFAGGNDVNGRRGSGNEVAARTMDLARKIQLKWPGLLVVSGSLIPRELRENKKTTKYDFFEEAISFDNYILKVNDDHHHIEFLNCFLYIGVTTNLQYQLYNYGEDVKVHLNEDGKVIILDIIHIIIECMTFNKWEDRDIFTPKGKKRISWK